MTFKYFNILVFNELLFNELLSSKTEFYQIENNF